MTFTSQNIPSTAKTSSASAGPTMAEKPTTTGCSFPTKKQTVPVPVPVDTVSTSGNSSSVAVALSSSTSLAASQESPRPAVHSDDVKAVVDITATCTATSIVSQAETSIVPQELATKATVDHKKLTVTKKKTKSKKTFRSLLKGMMKGTGTVRSIQAEKEALRQGLGGGAFVKVDKI